MFEAWGRGLHRLRWLVLVIGVVAGAAAAAWGGGVFPKLDSGNTFAPSSSQSQREANQAANAFGRNASDVVVLYRSAGKTIDDPAYQRAVTSALASLPAADVTKTATYWTTGQSSLVSADRHATYAVLQLAGGTDKARQDSYKAIKNDFSGTSGTRALAAAGITAQVGGTVPGEVAISSEVTSNIALAESISLPVLLILLVFIFGSAVAATLPVVIGGLAIAGSLAVLRLLTLTTTVAVYSVNITTILGLGLGIDYGLFVVTRFREELRRHETVQDAVAATVATAGRTVLVSGVTVAVALTSLMLFPVAFLRSMGYGGVATVGVDVLAAVTVLPALLAILGHRVNALRVRKGVGRARTDETAGGWYRFALGVMRRPAVYSLLIVVVLLGLGAPFLKIAWGSVDARQLPAGNAIHQVTDQLNSQFPANSTAPIDALVTDRATPAGRGQLAAYMSRAQAIPGVTGVQITGDNSKTWTGGGTATVRLDIGYRPQSDSTQARKIVSQLRALPAPPGGTVLVGGTTATLADELSSLGHTLPWMALLTGLATFILLFLAFGSLVLPLKAIVMNVLSLSATFGVIVWVFQWGHLSGPLHFTSTGTISPTMPILLLAIIFGLSMDYEVFLLSRVRERYDQTGDNTVAIASGVQHTGGLITSLAFLLIIVVGLFSISGIAFLKLLGVGMIVALIVDATVVRLLLVPAAMRLLGPACWWAPGPLRRLYVRHGLKEGDAPTLTEAAVLPAGNEDEPPLAGEAVPAPSGGGQGTVAVPGDGAAQPFLVHPDTLRSLLRQAAIDAGNRPADPADRQRISELEGEVRQLRRDNGILKAAAAYFARELDPGLPGQLDEGESAKTRSG